MLHWVFGRETKKWDLRRSAKTKADAMGEKQLGKLAEEEDELATEPKRKYTGLGLNLGKREELSDDKQGMSGSGDVSLSIFITSVSSSKSLKSFTNCFFYFSGTPGYRMAFDAVKKNEKFIRIQCQRREQQQQSNEKETSILLEDSKSQIMKQSHHIEVFKKQKKGEVC